MHKKVSHKRQYIDILFIKQLWHLLYKILFRFFFSFSFIEFNKGLIFFRVISFLYFWLKLKFFIIGWSFKFKLEFLSLYFNIFILSTELLLNNFLVEINSSLLFNSDFNKIKLFLFNKEEFPFNFFLLLLVLISLSNDFKLFIDIGFFFKSFFWKFILLYIIV